MVSWHTISSGAHADVERAFADDSRCQAEPPSAHCVGRLQVLPSSQGSCVARLQHRHAEPLRTGVAVIAARRPQYFEQVAASLANQTASRFDVFVYVDDGANRKKKAKIIDIARRMLPRATVRSFSSQQGIARISWQAQREIFATRESTTLLLTSQRYDQLILIEEDHLIGHTYVEALQLLIEAAEAYPEVGPVNGNFLDTPNHQEHVAHPGRRRFTMVRDEGCTFQIAPLDGFVDSDTHNVWAWGVSRAKWERMATTFEVEFTNSRLDHDTYTKTYGLIRSAMRRTCPQAGYIRWGSQDWLRACAFYHVGMRYKLQPTRRLMVYLGAVGMHARFNSRIFDATFQPLPVAAVSRGVADWPRKLCSYEVCRAV